MWIFTQIYDCTLSSSFLKLNFHVFDWCGIFLFKKMKEIVKWAQLMAKNSIHRFSGTLCLVYTNRLINWQHTEELWQFILKTRSALTKWANLVAKANGAKIKNNQKWKPKSEPNWWNLMKMHQQTLQNIMSKDIIKEHNNCL